MGEGRVAGEEKCRAAKGQRRLGSRDDGSQKCGVLWAMNKGVGPQPAERIGFGLAGELPFVEMSTKDARVEPRQEIFR